MVASHSGETIYPINISMSFSTNNAFMLEFFFVTITCIVCRTCTLYKYTTQLMHVAKKSPWPWSKPVCCRETWQIIRFNTSIDRLLIVMIEGVTWKCTWRKNKRVEEEVQIEWGNVPEKVWPVAGKTSSNLKTERKRRRKQAMSTHI